MREVERETQHRDRRPVSLQPTTKRFKLADSRLRGHRVCTCNKFGKVHEGTYPTGMVCYKCGNERHFTKDCPLIFESTIASIR